ncbi:MAG: hypothetical protein NUW37_00320 [Planctomycetes bacterium]|nr:hypothetical protein [Planctomycetota bacterium]
MPGCRFLLVLTCALILSATALISSCVKKEPAPVNPAPESEVENIEPESDEESETTGDVEADKHASAEEEHEHEESGIGRYMHKVKDSIGIVKAGKDRGYAADTANPASNLVDAANTLRDSFSGLQEDVAIWPDHDQSDFAGFVATAVERATNLANLMASFEQGADTLDLDDAVDMAGRSCGGCHRQFREEH